MDFDTNPSELVQLIADALRADVELVDEVYTFTTELRMNIAREYERRKIEIQLEASKLTELMGSLAGKEKRAETALYDSNRYEILVREQTSYGPSILRRSDEFVETDADNDIVYTLSPASDEYLLFLLHEISQIGSVKASWRYGTIFSSDPDYQLVDIFELLRRTGPRFLTLQLYSEKAKSVNNFIKYANAFLFEVSYNLDVALVQQRYLDELVRAGRIARIRRSTLGELDVPRRSYEQDLIHHYQMGVATDNPPLEYLSYYHVAEHFFESIFIEDLIESVQQRITHSGFSYKRKSDVRTLVNYVTKRTQLRDETLVYSELEALTIVLRKIVRFQFDSAK